MGLVSGVNFMCRVIWWMNVLSCEGVGTGSVTRLPQEWEVTLGQLGSFQGRDLQDAPAAVAVSFVSRSMERRKGT